MDAQVKDGSWDLDRLHDLLPEEIENRERCGNIQADLPSFAESADYNDGTSDSVVNLQIGADFPGRFLTGDTKRGETGDNLVAHGTNLGWVLSGRVPC